MKAWMIAVAALALAACVNEQALNQVPAQTSVRVTPGVTYDAARGLKLDVYAPAAARHAPLVLFFFGDRWQRGTRADYRFVGQALADQGFVAMVADTGRYPPATWRKILADGAHAVVWAQAHASDYGADGQHPFLMGYSSGAYDAAMLALDPHWLQGAGGSRDALAGAIGIAGPYAFLPITAPDLRAIFAPPETWPQTQPLFWVDGGNPPMLLIASRADRIVDWDSTARLFDRIKRRGGPVEEVLYDALSHRALVASLAPGQQAQADVMANVAKFIRRAVQAPWHANATVNSGIATQPSQGLVPELAAPVALPAAGSSVASPPSASVPAPTLPAPAP
ncbi:MAG TPA: alpha/beta hydrolase [Nevskiaceae bacterium]